MSLIVALNELQHRHGYLSEQRLRELSAQRRVPLHAIQAVISFYPHFRTKPQAKATVAVCRDMACHLAGTGKLCRKLETQLSGHDVQVHQVSCLGRCEQAPAVAVNDVPMTGTCAEDVIEAAGQPDQIKPLRLRAATRHWSFNAYDRPDQHYSTIKKLRDGKSVEVVEQLKTAKLRGMGGAAFPTGLKWELVARQSDPIKFVICNADESEPGTFKDRVILSDCPHLVLEGMMIAMHHIGAKKGYLFVRHEYEPERDVFAQEVESARRNGLLDESFDVEIFTSPGGYILGEETALLECMEDKRGEPRNKPPFPGEIGLHGKPTLINNVESFAAAVAILNRGADWWKKLGIGGCAGYKFISVSGHVNKPDVYQIRSGTTVRELIEMAGGVTDGKPLKAFAPGGASSSFLPADKANTPIDFESLQKAGSMLGSGALFVVAEGTDMMDLGTNVVRFFRNESCGKCVPCRIGSEKAVAILEKTLESGGRSDQLQLLEDLAETMTQTSICGLGQVALDPILSVIKYFPEDVNKHVK